MHRTGPEGPVFKYADKTNGKRKKGHCRIYFRKCILQCPFSDFTLSFVRGRIIPREQGREDRDSVSPVTVLDISFVYLSSFVPKVKSVIIIAWFLDTQILHFIQNFQKILVNVMNLVISLLDRKIEGGRE